jgi:hypothetical protein
MVDMTDPLNLVMPGPLPKEVKPAREDTGKTEDKIASVKSAVDTMPDAPIMPGLTLTEQLAQNNQAALRKKAEDDNTDILEVVKDKFMTETAGGTYLRRKYVMDKAREEAPDPTFKVTPDMLANQTEANQEWLAASASRADYETRLWDLKDWDEQQARSNALGPYVGFMASFMAGLPEGVLSGMAVARTAGALSVGSVRAAQSGKTSVALAQNFGENVVGNLAVLGAQSTWDTHVGPMDLAFGVGFAGVGTILSLPGVKRDIHTEAKFKDMQEQAMRDNADDVDAARHKLGEDATDEQVTAEVDRQRAAHIEDTIRSGDMPEDRKIFRDDEGVLRDDAEEEVKPPVTEEVEPPATEEVKQPPAEDVKQPTEEKQATEEKRPFSDKLPRELAGAKPRYKNAVVRFESDVDKALFIVSQKKPSKADAKYKEWLRSQGMDDSTIARRASELRDRIKAAHTAAKDADTVDILSARQPSYDPAAYASERDPFKAVVRLVSHPRKEISALAQRIMRALPDGEFNMLVLNKDQIRARSEELIKKHNVTGDSAKGLRALDRSYYDPYYHLIVMEDTDMRPGREWVMLHEAAHAATVLRMRKLGEDHPLIKELTRLREHVTMWVNSRAEIDDTVKARLADGSFKYLVQNNAEFVAGAFSTRDGAGGFIDMMKKIELPTKHESVWSSFVRTIQGILGMAPEDNSALTRLLDLSDRIMDSAIGKEAYVTWRGDFVTLAPNTPADLLNDPIAKKYGVSMRDMGTPARKAEAVAILSLIKKAIERAPAVNEARLSKLMDTALFSGGQATANVLARSKNLVARWISSELLESPGGATGRRATAAITRHMEERRFLGNTLNDVEAQYTQFRKERGATMAEDALGGRTRQQFDRLVALELEGRRAGATRPESHPTVVASADLLEAAYERMRAAQVAAKTVGWASLPESSVGYMPHRMSSTKVLNLTNAQKEGLHAALTDQFISIEGWDFTFADNLASRYIEGVERRGLGGFDAPIGMHQTGAADLVEDALRAMGMGADEVRATMKKFMAAGPGHTKKRINLDLTRDYTTAGGETFKLIDLFDTNQFDLLRSQAARVSGEVALAKHGVFGKAHLALIREAMATGDVNTRASARDLQAFDQIAAEFLNQPFGSQNKWVDRIMQYNALARLGGMGFTQAAETINGMVSVGVARTFAGIASMGRLRSEILALARGETVNNPLLKSLEDFGGAEFGTDSYKIVFPYDNSATGHNTYGPETVTLADRLLRGGAHVQGKLSFWRTIHAVQQRAFAEATVRKALEHIKGGNLDAQLNDMGVDEGLAKRIRGDLDSAATFENGRLTSFDITKLSDKHAATEFAQVVHRSVNQIIQGTFIGERGKWAHDPIARIMTQFRTFSLTSIEKQWARQRGNVGTAKSLGIIMGAMSVAAPLYIARTYVQSIGRKDQEDYLDKRLSWYAIARATLNYVAATGLAGDFLDAGQAVAGRAFEGNARGSSGGAGAKSFIGNMVSPSLGTIDDAWKAIQNTKDGTDPTDLIKVMPGSRLPYLFPAINALGN